MQIAQGDDKFFVSGFDLTVFVLVYKPHAFAFIFYEEQK
jgi:hypothetical protein